MVGKGHRVWIARLVKIVAIVSIVLFLAAYSALWYLNQTDSGSSAGPQSQAARLDESDEKLEGKHSLDPILKIARQALRQHLKRDRNYSATLVKHERVGGKLAPVNRMEVKVRYSDEGNSEDASQSPLTLPSVSVYLRFIEPKSLSGREVIWIQGQNDDLMTVHETGLLNIRRIQLAPNSRLAMIGNKYSMSEIGVAKLINKLIEKGVRDRMLGACEVKITEDELFANRKCQRIEVIHPERLVEIDGQKIEHEFYRAVIDMDNELEVPIHYASYLWPVTEGGEPLLEEEYSYESLRLNVVFTDMDFSPDNPKYNFPK